MSRPFNKNMKTGDITPTRHNPQLNFQTQRPMNYIQLQNNNSKQMHVSQIQTNQSHMIPLNQNHTLHSNINVAMNNMTVNPTSYAQARPNQRQNNQRNYNVRPNHQYPGQFSIGYDVPFINPYAAPLNFVQPYIMGPQFCPIPPQSQIRMPTQPSTSIANEVLSNPVLENQKIIPTQIQQQVSSHQTSQLQTRKKIVARLQDPNSLEDKDIMEIAKLPFNSNLSTNNQANKIVKNEEVKQNTASSNDNIKMEFMQIGLTASSSKTNDNSSEKKQNVEPAELPETVKISWSKEPPEKSRKYKMEKDNPVGKPSDNVKLPFKKELYQKPSANPNETTAKNLSSDNEITTQATKVVQPAPTESTNKKSQPDQIVNKKDDVDQKTVPVLVNEPVKAEAEEMETLRAIETKLENVKISNVPETKIIKDDKNDSLVKTKPESKVLDKSSTSQNKADDPKKSSSEKLNEVEDGKKQSSDTSNLQKTKSTSELLTYDVDFLKNLQFTEISTQKPNFAGNIGHRLEIVLDKARRDNESFDHSNDFQPKYAKTSMGRLMNSENKIPRKILSSSLTQDVKLRSIENAWKPILYKNSNDDSKDSTDVLIKNARGILNKLTPQNFKKLLDQFLGLRIDTEDKLRKMIELIFDKSVDEPAFCDQYALLCKHLSNIQIENDKGTPIKFNTLLLEQCQSLFEQDKYKDLELEKRQKIIDDCKDKDKKQALKDELDEDKRIVRKKSLGNIKFIGALYKNNRLKEKIMNECIYHLLSEKEEDSYECLCSLLKSIGETYESSIIESSKQDLKKNFDKQMLALEDVVKQNQVTSRIKFLIMDVLDMRKEGWKVRKLQDTFKPKTLDEVHEDIKRQDEISNREINQISKRNDSMKRKDWLNPQRKSQQNESLINIRKLTEQNKLMQTSFAPGGFFSNWSSGALGAKPVNESDNSKSASLISKNFSFRYQSEDKYKNSSLKQRNSSNVEKNVETVNTFGGNYQGGDESKDMAYIATYEAILKEYIETGSLDDCLRAIYQKSTENCVYLFVQSATEQACETYLKEIHKIGNLLAELVCVKKVISCQQFHKGLKYHLDGAQEVVKDIPLFFEYIGQILSHFFFKLSDQDRRSFFKEALRPCLEIGESLTIIIHLLKTLISSKEKVVEIAKKWVNAGLSFEDFVNNENEDVNELLESNGLSSLLNEINTLNTDIVIKIEAADFNDINRVLSNLNVKDKTLSKKIISALTEKCVLTSTNKLPNGDPQLDKDSFMSNLKVFQNLITENLGSKVLQDADIQLEIIYSFIKVSGNLKNPKDFLFNAAVSLQESDIVDQETFVKWYEEDRKDIPNNSVAILQLKRFIELLKTDESEVEDEIADVI